MKKCERGAFYPTLPLRNAMVLLAGTGQTHARCIGSAAVLSSEPRGVMHVRGDPHATQRRGPEGGNEREKRVKVKKIKKKVCRGGGALIWHF